MPGAADALQCHRDRPRRSDLANQVDAADIDPQLERSRRHHGAQFAGLQSRLGVQAQLARQASVVRQDGVFAQTLGEMMGHPLRQAPRVDEHQGGAIRADQIGRAVVDFVPHFVGRDCAELVARHLDRDFHSTLMTHVDGTRIVAQERRDILDRFHRGGEADALRFGAAVLFHQPVQPRQRQGKVRAALIVSDRVDFVHDQSSHAAQHLAGLCCGHQDEERFRRGDQNMRPIARHALAVGLRSVAGAQRGANGRQFHATLARQRGNLGQRNFEILVNVVAKRLERRDVDDLRAIGQRPQARAPYQAVDRR